MSSQKNIDLKPRQELRSLLLQHRNLADQLLKELDDPNVSPVELLNLLESTGALDERRAKLTRRLRDDVSSLRKREEDRSVRQVLLRALDFVGVPQPAWFLQEFVWARDRIDLKTRGFGSLRRDEYRAWRRRPGRRAAYITPGLDFEGHAIASIMARSDWPLAKRVVVEGARRLYALKGLESAFRARQELSTPDATDPYRMLIERCVTDAGLGPPPSQGKGEIKRFMARLKKEIRAYETVVAPAQTAGVESLATLSDEQKLWGKI